MKKLITLLRFIEATLETAIMALPIVFVVFILWAAVHLEKTRAAAAVQIEARASK